MKLLITVQNYYPSVSGVPVVVKYLAEGLVRKGHEVAVVTINHQNKDHEIINGVEVYRFNLGFNKLRGYTGQIKEYVDFVKNYPCDVLVNECSQCETTDLLLRHLKDIKAKKVFHSHGFSGLCIHLSMYSDWKHRLGTIYNKLRFKIYYSSFYKDLKIYDRVIFLSAMDSAKPYCDKYGILNTAVLENAADNIFLNKDLSDDSISKYLKPNEKKYFISIANYTNIKNQEFFMEAFYRAKIDYNYSLVMVGSRETSYYNHLKKLKTKFDERFGKKSVLFLCGVPRKDIPGLLSHAAGYLASSKWEEYSVSLVEAMMMGIPFISSDVGNARILPGGCVADSMEKFIASVEKLTKDREYWDTLSQNGRNYAQNHCTINHAVESFESLLTEVIE